jgi:spore germination cell wall hydrolase CwlJ-like protein
MTTITILVDRWQRKPYYVMGDIQCLALNIYYEARVESRTGQIAVAAVTLNRVRDPRFPKTICEVVYQKNHKTCQFSWTCQNVGPPKDLLAMAIAYSLAATYIGGFHEDPTQGALFFHSTSVSPRWSRRHIITIGRHKFYKV